MGLTTVSVIVVVGREPTYLAFALSTLIGQDFSSWEAIIVDCCLLEEESVRVRTCVEQIADPRIRIVHYTHDDGTSLYISRKWNFGIAAACGDLIAWMDDDDGKGPGWLTAMCAPFSNPLLAVTSSDGRMMDGDGNLSGVVFSSPADLNRIADDPAATFITTGQMVVRKSVFLQIGGFDEELACSEDFDLVLRICREPCLFIPSVLSWKRSGGVSMNHARVGGDTQEALRRIVRKNKLADELCLHCKTAFSDLFPYVAFVPKKVGFFHGPPCTKKYLGWE
jgi:GT2 family glycosyltransferase